MTGGSSSTMLANQCLEDDMRNAVTRILLPMALLPVLAAPTLWAVDVYPTKPVRFLVGFPPGGANDLVARVAAARMGPRLGQQVVVDNRSGAGGNIAHDLAAKATPDGYTMVLASVASLAMSPAMLSKLPYDPLRDFSPVVQLVDLCTLMSVHPSSVTKSMKDMIARARAQPGTLNVANPGTGSIAHLAFELFQHKIGRAHV